MVRKRSGADKTRRILSAERRCLEQPSGALNPFILFVVAAAGPSYYIRPSDSGITWEGKTTAGATPKPGRTGNCLLVKQRLHFLTITDKLSVRAEQKQ